MSSSVSHVTQAPVADQTVAVQPKAPAAKAPAAKAPQTHQDTVQISVAAQTALQEAQESRQQTAREASGGDSQAKRLLAKENAAARTQKS